jgi:hypothetical protein
MAAAACSDGDARSATMSPSPITLSAASVSASPSIVAAQLVSTPSCPVISPFRAQFHLNVQAGEERALLITDIRAQFRDTTSGFMVTLPAPVPIVQFGSALVEARSSVSFPIAIGLGCGALGRSGTIIVIVDTRDDRGRLQSLQATINVR